MRCEDARCCGEEGSRGGEGRGVTRSTCHNISLRTSNFKILKPVLGSDSFRCWGCSGLLGIFIRDNSDSSVTVVYS